MLPGDEDAIFVDPRERKLLLQGFRIIPVSCRAAAIEKPGLRQREGSRANTCHATILSPCFRKIAPHRRREGLRGKTSNDDDRVWEFGKRLCFYRHSE